MARLWHGGFESNFSGEFRLVSGAAATFDTSVVRTGTYSGKISGLSSATRAGFLQCFGALSDGAFFFRTYIRLDTLPTADNVVIALVNGTAINSTIIACIKVSSTGTLKLFTGTGSQVGSASAALTTGQWYMVDIRYDRTPAGGSQVLEARIDATVFATSSALTFAGQIRSIIWGGNLNAESQTTGVWYFEDLAINDSTGSFQTSYPGKGKILHALVSGAGDNTQWTIGGSAPAATNYESVDENSPDDDTTIVSSNTLNRIDDYTVAAISGITTSDTISVVAVGSRNSGIGTGASNATFALRIKASTGGTTDQGTTVISNGNAWTNNQSDNNSRIFSLVNYFKPGTSTPWTKTDLSAAQIGVKLVAASTNATKISTLWISVDFFQPEAYSQSVSDTVTLTETLTTQTAYARTLTDSISLVEAFAVVSAFMKSLTDSVTLTDTLSRGFTKQIDEQKFIYLFTEDGLRLLTEDGRFLIIEPSGVFFIESLEVGTYRFFSESVTLIEKLVIRLNGEWFRKIKQGWSTIRSGEWYERVVQNYFSKN